MALFGIGRSGGSWRTPPTPPTPPATTTTTTLQCTSVVYSISVHSVTPGELTHPHRNVDSTLLRPRRSIKARDDARSELPQRDRPGIRHAWETQVVYQLLVLGLSWVCSRRHTGCELTPPPQIGISIPRCFVHRTRVKPQNGNWDGGWPK